jgi:hypothetical protein
MNQPFEIKFDFPLAHSDLIVSLRATAEVHHSVVYYIIKDFHFAGNLPRKNDISIIPEQEVMPVDRDGQRVWVHRESKRESYLSIAIGKSIDAYLDQHKKN